MDAIRKVLPAVCFGLTAVAAAAQTDGAVPSGAARRWSLDDCMRYAVENSPRVVRQRLANDNYRQDYSEALASLFPQVSGSVYATMSYGRSIDPATNTYTDNRNLDNNYELSAQMPVFAGLSGINTVRAARVARLLGAEEARQAADEVALETMRAYFDAVYYSAAASLASDQLEQSRRALARSRRMEGLGLSSPADVAQFEAQVASDDYLLTQQRNRRELALIVLRQKMNYPAGLGLEIETAVGGDAAVAGRVADADAVAASALELMPSVGAARRETARSRLLWSAEKGRYWPSLYIGAGYSTRFFKNYDSEVTRSFGSQFRGNRGHYFGATLSVPVFGGLMRRTAVHRRRNDMLIARQREIEAERSLRSEVSQTLQELDGYGKEYVQADKKVSAAELAHRAVLEKYEQGLVSPLDVQTSANLLLEARSQRLNARLQYIIRSRIVDYYCGQPLVR